MKPNRLSSFQKDLFIVAGMVGVLGAVILIAVNYSYTPPAEPEPEIDPKKQRAFHLEHHLDKFKFQDLTHFEMPVGGLDSVTFSQLTPINHTVYQHVFQFKTMPPGRYNRGTSAPMLHPGQSYFYSSQPPVRMWTGYKFDWITVLFDPQPDSWRLISCFYNREKPANEDTPGGEKGEQATWTYFPLAEYSKTDDGETISYSEWIGGDTIVNTLIESYEEDGLAILDSSVISRRMMVYGKTVVFEESKWRNGKPVHSPPVTMDKPTFLE